MKQPWPHDNKNQPGEFILPQTKRLPLTENVGPGLGSFFFFFVSPPSALSHAKGHFPVLTASWKAARLSNLSNAGLAAGQAVSQLNN